MIEAKGIHYSYGSRKLLESVNFKLECGRFYGLLGPNGAGKSTLLRILSGELKLESGSLTINERELARWPLKELAQLRGALPQRAELSFDYRVEEVVALGRSPFSNRQNESINGPKAIQAALEAFQLQALRERSYLNLSGGEQQRVQLARVFAQIWRAANDHSPRILLLDEPTAGLDLSHQHQLLQLLQQTARQGATILAALHDPNQAAAHADNLLVLCGGKLVAQGEVGEVLNNELFERYFCVEAEVFQTAHNGKRFSFRAPRAQPEAEQ